MQVAALKESPAVGLDEVGDILGIQPRSMLPRHVPLSLGGTCLGSIACAKQVSHILAVGVEVFSLLPYIIYSQFYGLLQSARCYRTS